MIDLTQSQLEMLGAMARQYHTNTGKPPMMIKEIADHWYEMSNRVVVKEHIDEDGRHHPAQTLVEVDAPDHMLECIWLRELENRPDAEALLTQAMDRAQAAGIALCPCCRGRKWLLVASVRKLN